MKQKEEIQPNISLSAELSIDELGNDLGVISYDTPMTKDAFVMDDKEKIEIISRHFQIIMETLGLDLNDDSLKGTPRRIAKMYVKEVFSGLNPKNKPHVRLFENKFKYDEMIVEKNITFYSHCEHHFVPIYGKAHVAYFSTGKVIGLSKINRIVQYFAKRPQVQERLTIQIAQEMMDILNTEHIAVVMDANHLCVSSRGVADTNSRTGTAHFNGKFKEEKTKSEFLNYINTQ